MKSTTGNILILTIALTSSVALAKLCPQWGDAKQVGSLDKDLLREASGIAVSSKFERLYHINDSGDGPFFYTTDFKGNNTQKIEIEDFEPEDTEDLSLGPCGNTRCLYIADIGDNDKERDWIEILAIEEVDTFTSPVKPLFRKRLVYPKKAKNAEGFAVHPSGDLFILSKSKKLTKVFRLTATELQAPGEAKIMKKIGELDLSTLVVAPSKHAKKVSAFDIAPDGKSFIFLTYTAAFEFDFDLTNQIFPKLEEMEKGADYQRIPIKKLPKQESLSYLPEGKAFLYGTEHTLDSEAANTPLMRVECSD